MARLGGWGWGALAGVIVMCAAASLVIWVTGEGVVANACNPKNNLGYVSKEPCEVCVSGEGCFNAIPMVERAQRAASAGDLVQAISTMEDAMRIINGHRLGRIQRWDNLAELYCLRAAEEPDRVRADDFRRDGLAMIAEFRCGVRVQTGATACALSNGPDASGASTAWGLVPNPALSPMCYESLCERGFQNDNEYEFPDPTDAAARSDWDSHYEEMDDVSVDAANLGEIEQLCRRGSAS
jgi:hypothetical protein